MRIYTSLNETSTTEYDAEKEILETIHNNSENLLVEKLNIRKALPLDYETFFEIFFYDIISKHPMTDQFAEEINKKNGRAKQGKLVLQGEELRAMIREVYGKDYHKCFDSTKNREYEKFDSMLSVTFETGHQLVKQKTLMDHH